jgi:hypothetical protein
MFTIVYRLDGTLTRLETDDLYDARFVLQDVAVRRDADLIDFSPELDGALDGLLDHVRLSVVSAL